MVILLCEFDGVGMRYGCTIGYLRGSLLRRYLLPCSAALDPLVRFSEVEKRDFIFFLLLSICEVVLLVLEWFLCLLYTSGFLRLFPLSEFQIRSPRRLFLRLEV